jgi:tripartite-type tricarboxylate transporter receptor subunit TctC
MKKIAVLMALGTMLASPALADPVEDFYKGKSLRLIIGFDPPGGYDLYGRVAATYLGNFIPGKPTVVPQNMPGAGSKTAARFLYTAAPKDGTVIGVASQQIAQDTLIEGTVNEMDVTKFGWIGRLTSNIDMGITWASTPIKSIEDLRKREVVVGGTGFAASSAMVPRLLNQTAGTKFKIVTGYKGSGDITLAMERGEVEVVGGTGWASTKVNHPDWIKEKKITILYQLAAERHRELPDVPTVAELALKQEDQAMLRFIGASADVGRYLIAPPGIPADRFAALRKAFDAMMKDKDFIADMEKRNVDLDYMAGDKLAEMIAGLMKTSPEIIARAKAAMEVK